MCYPFWFDPFEVVFNWRRASVLFTLVQRVKRIKEHATYGKRPFA